MIRQQFQREGFKDTLICDFVELAIWLMFYFRTESPVFVLHLYGAHVDLINGPNHLDFMVIVRTSLL